ncbi:unnamed protein product [Arabis nemorensis]|uniref:Uncharacterized protein n=1 Tax=Arabis nemorensis TaxID=586526 RepID=A0A565B5H2_9BRAS|nr:unnamed protein product [Arabis nemorensis]
MYSYNTKCFFSDDKGPPTPPPSDSSKNDVSSDYAKKEDSEVVNEVEQKNSRVAYDGKLKSWLLNFGATTLLVWLGKRLPRVGIWSKSLATYTHLLEDRIITFFTRKQLPSTAVLTDEAAAEKLASLSLPVLTKSFRVLLKYIFRTVFGGVTILTGYGVSIDKVFDETASLIGIGTWSGTKTR